jgi:hypothetical protein
MILGTKPAHYQTSVLKNPARENSGRALFTSKRYWSQST